MKKWTSLLLAVILVLSMGYAAAAEGQDLVGAVTGNTYVNERFGVRVSTPDDWHFYSYEEIVLAMGYDASYASSDGLTALLEQLGAVCVMHAMPADSGRVFIDFSIEDLRNNSFLSEEGYFSATRNIMSNNLFTLGCTNVTLTGKTFAVGNAAHAGSFLTGKIGEMTIYSAYILFKADQYMGVLNITAASEEEENAALAMCGAKMLQSDGSFVRGLSEPWSVIGTVEGTYWDKDFPMIEAAEGRWVSAPLQLKAGDELKVRRDGDWTVNYGITDGVCIQDGKNVSVPEDGVYIVTLDTVGVTLSVDRMDRDSWSVIGTVCGTNWDIDFPMWEDESGVWHSMPLTLKAGDKFKVRMNGSWDMNYGITDGVVLQDGEDIVVETDGVYVVTLDLNALILSYGAQTSSTDSWGVIGTICGTNWDTDFPMHEKEPGVWVSDSLELKAGDKFKVRMNGSWDMNYGITDGVMLPDGGDIVVETDGVYVVTLDLNRFMLTW